MTLQVIKKAVYSWSIRFREVGYANEQLRSLSEEYFDDLQSEHVTVKEFEASCAHVRKRCRFFPKMADILSAVDEYRKNPPVTIEYRQKQLSDSTSNHSLTPEEIARNKSRIADIQRMLSGELSMDQAISSIEGKSHIKEFGA